MTEPCCNRVACSCRPYLETVENPCHCMTQQNATWAGCSDPKPLICLARPEGFEPPTPRLGIACRPGSNAAEILKKSLTSKRYETKTLRSFGAVTCSRERQ